MPEPSAVNGGTRERLLEAAGEVFAELGFRAATVRDICRRANSNVAAISYHFGSKEELYAAVLQYTYQCASPDPSQDAEPAGAASTETAGAASTESAGAATTESAGAASAEERLHLFVRSFLLRIFGDGRPSWHSKLMAREMIEPTAALDAVIEQSIRPRYDLLVSIIRELAGNDARSATVHLCASSIVGQIMHFHRGRPVITRLNPQLKYGPENIEVLADHITRFSLSALEGISAEESA